MQVLMPSKVGSKKIKVFKIIPFMCQKTKLSSAFAKNMIHHVVLLVEKDVLQPEKKICFYFNNYQRLNSRFIITSQHKLNGCVSGKSLDLQNVLKGLLNGDLQLNFAMKIMRTKLFRAVYMVILMLG